MSNRSCSGACGKCKGAVAPTIAIQPASKILVVGGSVTFNVLAAGTAPLGYQWFKDGAPVPGATNSALSFATVQIPDHGLYSVVVSSPWGSVTNAAAQLVVNVMME